METYFSVTNRNPGHWDIYNDKRRLFVIRGGPGAYFVRDERSKEAPNREFATVGACMNYITDILMYELIVAEGQAPKVVESWNVK